MLRKLKLLFSSKDEKLKAKIADIHIITYDEAKANPNGFACFDGDYGGDNYVVVPMRLVHVDHAALEKLLKELSSLDHENNNDGEQLVYEILQQHDGKPYLPSAISFKPDVVFGRKNYNPYGLWINERLFANKKQLVEDYLAVKVNTILE